MFEASTVDPTRDRMRDEGRILMSPIGKLCQMCDVLAYCSAAPPPLIGQPHATGGVLAACSVPGQHGAECLYRQSAAAPPVNSVTAVLGATVLIALDTVRPSTYGIP